MKLTFAAALLLVATAATAHPGSAIAVSKAGTVYFVDTGAGVFAIEAAGRIERREGPAFHWFAFDPESRFRNTPWPSIPGAEFRSAGNVVLSSDYPVTIGRDGRFYYADGRGHIVAIAPSGARSVFATLPPARNVNGLAPAPDGSLLYTEDRAIRKIDARGRVSTIVPNLAVPNCAKIPSDEPQNGAYLRGLAVADDGTIYVAAAGCGALMRVDAAGRASALLRTAPPWSPTAVAVNGREVYVLEYLHTASDNRREWIPRIRKIGGDGKVTVLGYKR